MKTKTSRGERRRERESPQLYISHHGQWLLQKGEIRLYKISSACLRVERPAGVKEDFVLFIPCIRRKINSCLASQT